MDLHVLMKDFALFEGAQVGHGPRHPTHPQGTMSQDIARFLDTFSFLRQDTGYTQFLETYAGASIFKKDRLWMVDILGFAGGDVCSSITDMEGDIVDECGFLMYSYIIIETRPLGSRQISFGFDATQQHRKGVYRVFADNPTAWHWYCPSFLIWLDHLIRYHGQLDDIR